MKSDIIQFFFWLISISDRDSPCFNAISTALTPSHAAPRVHCVRTAVSGPPVFRTRRSRLLWEALWHGEGIKPLLAAAHDACQLPVLQKCSSILFFFPGLMRLIITAGDRPKRTLMSLWCDLISELEYDWQAAVLTNVCLALALFAAFCVC